LSSKRYKLESIEKREKHYATFSVGYISDRNNSIKTIAIEKVTSISD